MDRRERYGDPVTAMQAMLQGWQGTVWTAVPGTIVAQDGGAGFSGEHRTVRVQPTLQAQIQNPDGSFDWVTLPVLLDCPIVFPSGGGATLTFPIRPGDECIVVFSSRCIDSWWQSGGRDAAMQPTPQVQAELRMHDLSDGFAIVGVNSVPYVIPEISSETAQFRSDSGDTFFEVHPSDTFARVHTTGDILVEAGGNMTVTVGADLTATVGGDAIVSVSGDATIAAGGNLNLGAGGDVNITGVLIINGTPFLDHIHDKTKPGSAGEHSGKVVP